MKISIRRGVFETNSSSTHTITMCSEEEYNKWKNGELVFDRWQEELVEPKEDNKYHEYQTYDEFWEDEFLEGFYEKYTTNSGEKVIAFGLYGYDG